MEIALNNELFRDKSAKMTFFFKKIKTNSLIWIPLEKSTSGATMYL